MMNARLKNVFSLSSKVTVYVPATIDIDKEIDNKEFVIELQHFFLIVSEAQQVQMPWVTGQVQQLDL